MPNLLSEIGMGLGQVADAFDAAYKRKLEEQMRQLQMQQIQEQMKNAALNRSFEIEKMGAWRSDRATKEAREAEGFRALEEAAQEMERNYGVPANLLLNLEKSKPGAAVQVMIHRLTEPEATYHVADNMLIRIPKRGTPGSAEEFQTFRFGPSWEERQARMEAAREQRAEAKEGKQLVSVFDRQQGTYRFVTKGELLADKDRYAPQAAAKSDRVEKIVADPIAMGMAMRNPDAFIRLHGLNEEEAKELMKRIEGARQLYTKPSQSQQGAPKVDPSVVNKLIYGE